MLISVTPAAVAVNTIKSRVSAVTGIASPVVSPLLIVPIATTPVSGGANVTIAPGIGANVLSGVVELYSCAVRVTVVPTRANATVVLKYAAIEVIVPSLGTEKAKFVNKPGPPVKSIVAPNTVASVVEVPKPTIAGSPANPPNIVVGATGNPDANGIIAPAPAGPVSPVAPVGPVGPVAPVGPVGPVGPVSPVAPVGPVGPVAPVAPVGPVGPVAPVAPVGPVGPVAPVGPVGPVSPVAPVGPVAPIAPVGPVGPV
ncbi:MAG: mucin 17-like protein, partial [Oscillospiraceae bacterium]|nr:mucin 17-like protein [Oscillospiraceae bacterium]